MDCGLRTLAGGVLIAEPQNSFCCVVFCWLASVSFRPIIMAMLPIEKLRVARALQNFGSHLWQLPSLQEMFSSWESRNPHKALFRYRHGSLDMIKIRCRNNKMNVEVFEMCFFSRNPHKWYFGVD